MSGLWVRIAIVAAVLPVFALAEHPLNRSVRVKLGRLRDWKAQPGEVILFSPAEINAFANEKVPEYVPQGIRGQRVSLGENVGTAFAYMDFLKMKHARIKGETNWFLARILEGERPVTIRVRMESGGGKCTVYLTRLQVAQIAATGSVLDFMVNTFFLSLFPDAKVNQPFELDYNIDALSLKPDGIRAHIKKTGWIKGPPPESAKAKK
jgi:hypothetical protein